MNEMIAVINRHVAISAKKRASRRRRGKDRKKVILISINSETFPVVVVVETRDREEGKLLRVCRIRKVFRDECHAASHRLLTMS